MFLNLSDTIEVQALTYLTSRTVEAALINNQHWMSEIFAHVISLLNTHLQFCCLQIEIPKCAIKSFYDRDPYGLLFSASAHFIAYAPPN